MIEIPSTHKLELKLDNFLWHCTCHTKVESELVMHDDGLHVKFTVHESNPLITTKEQQEPMLMVCQDSAVELFLAFSDKVHDDNFKPMIEECMYVNIEVNAAACCYAKYGKSRKGRTAFTRAEIDALHIQTHIAQDYWTCEFIVPREFVKKIMSYDAFAKDNVFALNLYKISETKEIEHFIAFNKIDNPTPNFHLPQFFALCKAV